MSPIDASERLTSQAISQVLAWRPGDRLPLTGDAGVVAVHRDLHGLVTVSARCSVAIPAALRYRCGLRPGDQVLLAALPGDYTLVACTSAVVERALRAVRSRRQSRRRSWCSSGWACPPPIWWRHPRAGRQLRTWVKNHVVAGLNARGGRSAQEHLVAAALPAPAGG